MIRALPGLCLRKCLPGKNELKVHWLLLLLLLPFKNLGCMGELLLITVKSCFFFTD